MKLTPPRSIATVVTAVLFAIPTADVVADSPSVELIGLARLSGELRDDSSFDQKLEDGSPANRFGGLSAIEFTGNGDQFWLLPDRGAGDGAVTYPCRVHLAKLTVDAKSQAIDFELVSTVPMTSTAGAPLVGSQAISDAEKRSDRSSWTALDPEGIRQWNEKTLIISDEYGPHVMAIDTDGKVVKEFSIPESYRLRAPVDGVYTRGIYPNRGLEGIAITPSGDTLVTVPQSPLIQDGRIKGDKCLGLNCRWLVLGNDGSVKRQIVYQLEDESTGVSEVLAVDEHRFLVLERDSKSGDKAKIKRIFLADINDASDVSDIDALPTDAVPAGVRVVKKSVIIDLQDEHFGIGGAATPEKPEGLCWGNPLPDGRRTLWVCCDNDFEPNRDTEIFCFAVSGL